MHRQPGGSACRATARASRVPSYTALASLVLNFIVAIILTPIFNAAVAARGYDETEVEHYG